MHKLLDLLTFKLVHEPWKHFCFLNFYNFWVSNKIIMSTLKSCLREKFALKMCKVWMLLDRKFRAPKLVSEWKKFLIVGFYGDTWEIEGTDEIFMWYIFMRVSFFKHNVLLVFIKRVVVKEVRRSKAVKMYKILITLWWNPSRYVCVCVQ